MSFSRSDALFSPADLAAVIGAEYETQLHFRRTFVEKMFAIHGKVELLKRDGQALGTYARHGPYPPWVGIQASLLELRELL